MHALNEGNVELNRKSLADIAMNHPEAFTALVKSVKK